MIQRVYVIMKEDEYFASINDSHIFWARLFTDAKVFLNRLLVKKYKATNKIDGDVCAIDISPYEV